MRKVLIIIVILSLTSCVITFPGTRYKHLTEDQKKKVVVCNSPIDSLANDGKVYLVTIEQMQEFLKSKSRVLIYEYASFCLSDHCVNPAVIEKECIRAGVQFCMVSVSYEDVFNIPVRNTPILAIEPTTLGKKIGKDCSKVFFDKLTGTTCKTRGYGRYYYYLNGEFKGCYDDYSDALTGK